MVLGYTLETEQWRWKGEMKWRMERNEKQDRKRGRTGNCRE
jgi:hypothetical protein